ncbi:MAG: Gfo/Idh/MocA family oxidoreductase [Clostridia bacterium]|nr:Gfo/Idh/MocA family oxidoreductase [Clostridia bacterium]
MKHNLCVVGYGGMGGWHVQNALKSDVVDLKGIYDIKPERAKAAEENGIYAYSSLEEVLNDESVDIITIATPNDVHEEIAIKALNAGKNVISEKPVTMTLESLQRMIDAANKNNRIFSVHQNRRWDNDFRIVKDLVQSGKLGEIYNIESRVQGSRGIPGDWRAKKEFGGGMLYDWGIHLIDQALLMFNSKVKKLYCTFDNITNSEVDDGFKLSIYFENGAEYFIDLGTYNFVQLPRFYVRGEKGTATVENWTSPAIITAVTEWGQKDVMPVRTAAGLTKTMAPRDQRTTETYEYSLEKEDVHDYYRNFCKAIEGTEEQIVTHKQMMRVLSVIEACFESVEKGQVVDFDDKYAE